MELNTKLAPIVIFVYNRPHHTLKTLERLNEIALIEDSVLFVFSDDAKEDGDKQKVEMVRDIIEGFKSQKSKFKEIHITKANGNQGLVQSIISGVSQILESYNKVIVLEDDLIVSNDFLVYMNQALNYYENIDEIWSISGYTFPMKATKNYGHDIYIARRGCSWGWGTWKDRWETVDWNVSDYESNMKLNVSNVYEFGRWGRDMPIMLDENVYGLKSSWAIRWCYSQYKQDRYTVYPVESRVKNEGTDGSGVNYTKKTKRYDTDLKLNHDKCKFEVLVPDKKIEKEFRRKYKKFLGLIRDSIKWYFIKIGIIKVGNGK